jgi:hypothetical protein
MQKGYPTDWFEYISKNRDVITHPPMWEDIDAEFISFYDKFCATVRNSSILLIGTGGAEKMFTEWPRVLLGCGASSITYIEIFEGYREKFKNREYKIIAGDIREIDNVITNGEFDLICWFHGPEHIKNEEMPQTFDKLRKLCGKGVVSICPFGSYYDEDMICDNVYEIHIQHNMVVSDFDRVQNINFFTVGDKDLSDAMIFGYYFKEEANG